MKTKILLLGLIALVGAACSGVLDVDVEATTNSTATPAASQTAIAAPPSPTPTLPPRLDQEAALPAPTATTPGWTEYRSEALQVAFAYPATWEIELIENTINLRSPDRAGFESDSELVYFVFVAEHPNPERRPFPEGVSDQFGEQIAQAFTFTTVSIGETTAYQTESLPSQSGALNVFVDDGDRYVLFGLAPYDSQTPWPGQDRHAAVFDTLLQTVRLLE